MEQTQGYSFGQRHAGKARFERGQQTRWINAGTDARGRQVKDREGRPWASVSLIKWVPGPTLKCRLEKTYHTIT